MAIENSRKKIGSLFGGEITSINYNFQSGSESATCTLTLISENNEFAVPKMNERVNIPPFGIEMIVLETSLRKDPQYTVLQVELIDSLSEILDREMVFIWGTHTDMRGNLSSNGYQVDKTLFLPQSAYPRQTTFSDNINRPTTSRNFIKDFGNGMNVIGFGRLTMRQEASQTITIDPAATQLVGGNSFVEEKKVVFDAFELNTTLTRDSNILSEDIVPVINLGYNPTQGELKFGYTASDLFKLFVSKGISFKSNDERFLSDDNIMFSDSGTFRSVLSSVLGKIGRSFYVDPFTQKINIITNADIASINRNLNNLYLNFENTEAAEQLTLNKSIKNVEATHHFIKGQATIFEEENRDFNIEPRSKKHVLYRLQEAEITQGTNLLNAGDAMLISNLAPFYIRTQDADATDKFAFALGAIKGTSSSDFYGQQEYNYVKENKIEKAKGSWYSDINSDDRYNFFDFKPEDAEEAIRLLSSKGKNAISVSEAGYINFIESFVTLWGAFILAAQCQRKG